MADALKDIYSVQFIKAFANKVSKAYKNFDADTFTASVLSSPWEELTLKARMHRIAVLLGEYLPKPYEAALEILFSITDSCSGFPYLLFPDFVATYGQDEKYFELSMEALEIFTKQSSSEFAIRPFLLREPERVMKYMLKWSMDENEHVRRFSSEGCRPRLPWGAALPMFKKDPSLVLEVLENLKADPSLYVRKSVANNLNDITKDNPAKVLEIAKKWLGQTQETDWILRQGCRTLVRKADAEAMSLFGYTSLSDEKIVFKDANLSVQPEKLQIGESCELSYSFNIDYPNEAHLRIEYGIDFVKAKGKTSRKLFLLSDKTVPSDSFLKGTRIHSFEDLTTRKHYCGVHKIVLLVNGKEIAETSLDLLVSS